MALTVFDPTQTSKVWKYRRPQLEWNSVTQVSPKDVVVTNQIDILFPDGEYRTETTLTQYRFDITRNAVLTGSKQSGLRTGLSEATNTWYALYAVKAQDTTGIVTVGDMTLPLKGNISTLDSAFGSNSWEYLGLIRNGDNSGTTGDILLFSMDGDLTVFRNEASSVNSTAGTRLANATATTVTWTYAPGTGTAQIPDNISNGIVTLSLSGFTGTDQRILLTKSTGGLVMGSTVGVASASSNPRIAPVSVLDGFQGSNGQGSSSTWHIFLSGFWDTALGVGPNPLV